MHNNTRFEDNIPIISVILTIFNVQNYLNRSLNALVAQTINNIEVIMVDDGSSDLSPNICDEYASRYSNFKVIHKVNGGVSSARNCGLKFATGKYIAFCDPDDFYNSDSLASFLKVASKHVDCHLFIGSGYNIVNELGDCVSYIKQNSLQTLSIDEAMIAMENYGIGGFPWNKLFLNRIIKENHISPSEFFANLC